MMIIITKNLLTIRHGAIILNGNHSTSQLHRAYLFNGSRLCLVPTFEN